MEVSKLDQMSYSDLMLLLSTLNDWCHRYAYDDPNRLQLGVNLRSEVLGRLTVMERRAFTDAVEVCASRASAS